MRIPSRLLLFFLFLRELRARVIHRPRVNDLAIARLHDPARGMRRWAEFVGLAENARLGIVLLRDWGCGEGAGS